MTATHEVPRLRGLPGIGVLLPFARDALGFTEHAATHGDMVRFRIMEHELVMLNHPSAVEEALVDLAKSMHKDAIYALIRPLLGNGLVTSEGELWKRHRKLIAPSFQKRHVDHYAAEFANCAHEAVERLTHGEQLDAHALFMSLTQRIVLRTLFGTDIEAETDGVGHAIETVMDGFSYETQGLGRVLPGFVPTPTRRRTEAAIAELDRLIAALLAARRRAGLGMELLSRLIEARDEQGGLDDTELRDEAITVFVAGHETTALALTYTVVLLGENPDAWGPLQQEVDAVLGDRLPEAADFGRLPHTTAVIKESMRLLPPVWAIGREAMEDVVIGGHPVEKGTQILVSQWVLHRDARWFEDPLKFRPERWLDEAWVQSLPRMAYLPFGGGPRICIGNHFAMLEAVTILATLARKMRLVATGGRPKLAPSITMRPAEPVPARVERR